MTIVLFILEAAAVTAFFSSGPASFALLAPVGVAAMFLLARGCALLLSRKTGRASKALEPGIVIALSPACLLFLKHLSAAVFLMDIRGYLVPLAAAGTVVLLSMLFAENRRPAETARAAPRRPWLWLFLVSFAANAFFASGLVFPPHPLTGDEPHYLLITKSLIDDGDIDLYNNTVQEDHRRFYPGVMETHAKPGRGGPGTLYSRHLPGLSILLLPFYALADRMESLSAFVFIVRLPICLLTALLGAVFFLFALDLTGSRRAATAAWCVFSFSAPVFFYSSLIYPEVPAALIAILAFRVLFMRPKAGPAALLLSGAGIGLLPWFSAKYAVLSIVLFILAAAPRLKKFRSSRRELLHLSAAPVVLGLLYLFFLRVDLRPLQPRRRLHRRRGPANPLRGPALESGERPRIRQRRLGRLLRAEGRHPRPRPGLSSRRGGILPALAEEKSGRGPASRDLRRVLDPERRELLSRRLLPPGAAPPAGHLDSGRLRRARDGGAGRAFLRGRQVGLGRPQPDHRSHQRPRPLRRHRGSGGRLASDAVDDPDQLDQDLIDGFFD